MLNDRIEVGTVSEKFRGFLLNRNSSNTHNVTVIVFLAFLHSDRLSLLFYPAIYTSMISSSKSNNDSTL